MARVRVSPARRRASIAGSAYLGAIVPESADLHNLLGIALAARGGWTRRSAEFREALRLDPDSAADALAPGRGAGVAARADEALAHLRRSVQLDPGNAVRANDLNAVLALDQRS